MKYEFLFKPLKVNKLILANRIMASPMGVVNASAAISTTDYGGLSLYDKSLGGAGLICVNADNDSESDGMFSKYNREITREMIYVVKQSGAKIAAEVSCNGKKKSDGYCYGPMTGLRFDGAKMREMTRQDMLAYENRLVSHCMKIRDFGFDMLFLCFSCDSLCSQFISPVFNQRNDEYGGSLENRVRFPAEMVRMIRKGVGPDFPIQIQVSRDLKTWESYDPEDILYFLNEIKDEVDMINITTGMDTYGGTPNHYRPNVHSVTTGLFPHMIGIEFAEKVRKTLNKPVSLVGGISDPKAADDAIREGKLDAVMLGRQLVADPFYPKKLREGRDDDVVPCLRCANCYCYSTEHRNVVCSVNPRFRRENRVPLRLEKAEHLKKVVIVGGGPAGCKAAITAADRGHQVILIEKEKRLGGVINCADYSDLKQDLRRYRDYLLHQVEKREIEVKLETKADRKLIEELSPDALIIAVGASPWMPEIPGMKQNHVCNIMDVYQNYVKLSGKVVIIGGGQAGCELALEASEVCDEVTIIEGNSEISANSNSHYRLSLKMMMEEKANIQVLTQSLCQEITEHSVIVNHKFRGLQVILATGFKPNTAMKESLYGIVAETYEVGDCEKVASVCEATNYAYFIAANM